MGLPIFLSDTFFTLTPAAVRASLRRQPQLHSDQQIKFSRWCSSSPRSGLRQHFLANSTMARQSSGCEQQLGGSPLLPLHLAGLISSGGKTPLWLPTPSNSSNSASDQQYPMTKLWIGLSARWTFSPDSALARHRCSQGAANLHNSSKSSMVASSGCAPALHYSSMRGKAQLTTATKAARGVARFLLSPSDRSLFHRQHFDSGKGAPRWCSGQCKASGWATVTSLLDSGGAPASWQRRQHDFMQDNTRKWRLGLLVTQST